MLRRTKEEPKKEEKKKEAATVKVAKVLPKKEIVPVIPIVPEPVEVKVSEDEYRGVGISGNNSVVNKAKGRMKEKGDKVGKLVIQWCNKYLVENPST